MYVALIFFLSELCSLVVRIVLRRANERKERDSEMHGIVSSDIARWVHHSSDD